MGDLELRYEHLGHRDTPARRERRRQLQERVDEILAEQELRNQKIREDVDSGIPSLQVTDRYAEGKSGTQSV